jgi:hypothetical protein
MKKRKDTSFSPHYGFYLIIPKKGSQWGTLGGEGSMRGLTSSVDSSIDGLMAEWIDPLMDSAEWIDPLMDSWLNGLAH